MFFSFLKKNDVERFIKQILTLEIKIFEKIQNTINDDDKGLCIR